MTIRCTSAARAAARTSPRPVLVALAVAGLLELASTTLSATKVVIDPTGFAGCPKGERSPMVLAAALVKAIPGSAAFSSTYPPQTITQNDVNIRTHWALLFDQPGTTFTLDLTVRCVSSTTGQSADHIDRYVWQVAATLQSVRALIDALDADDIGTSGIPAIVSVPGYQSLLATLDRIAALVKAGDVLNAKAAIATLVNALASDPISVGVLTTAEHPAADAIGAALEYISSRM